MACSRLVNGPLSTTSVGEHTGEHERQQELDAVGRRQRDVHRAERHEEQGVAAAAP
jgi:hypothetical protein